MSTDQAVAVVIDGSQQDRPALRWAAEEASQLGRPLLITHAVGHLPVHLGYAERDVARRRRRERGDRVVAEAAEWVTREVPGLTIEAAVRMLEPAELLSSIGPRASVMTRTATSWGQRDHDGRPGPVIVAPDSGADVIAYADDYANRRGVELLILEDGRDDTHRLLSGRAGRGSLALVAGPRQGWRSTLALLACAATPVALVPDTHRRFT